MRPGRFYLRVDVDTVVDDVGEPDGSLS